MLKNYLLIAWRNITKNKVFSFINIAGLAIGLACFTLIALYVVDELSYDRYNEKASRIYRADSIYCLAIIAKLNMVMKLFDESTWISKDRAEHLHLDWTDRTFGTRSRCTEEEFGQADRLGITQAHEERWIGGRGEPAPSADADPMARLAAFSGRRPAAA